MFNWTNTTLPKLTDYFNNTSRNPAQLFTVAWVDFLGPWFFAALLGVVASALYIKTRKAVVPLVFFVVCNLLLGSVMPVDFGYIIGLIAAFTIGFLLYQVFVSKEE